MKNSIFLFAVTFFMKYNSVFCNDDILSKFHQTGYKVKDFRIQLISSDRDFANFFEIKAFKYNRTTTAHNVTINCKLNVEDKLEILVQANKFLSNEYRHFPVRFQVNLNKCFNANVVGLQEMTKCGNLTNFIFYKDVTYHTCNFLIDETKLPPLIPNGKYKIEIQILYLNKEVGMMHVFQEVYTPIYPSN